VIVGGMVIAGLMKCRTKTATSWPEAIPRRGARRRILMAPPHSRHGGELTPMLLSGSDAGGSFNPNLDSSQKQPALV
jgi:hypothetical protein